MATRKIMLTRDWQQVTDGTQTVVIQIPDAFQICDSPEKPEEDAPALQFTVKTLTITPDTVAWVRLRGMNDEVMAVIL
ncbi:hypothetical protein DO659_03405 [Salmonella enterica subsp. enterica serovar Minnesota]|nr:hypothetical protein [Salmonella enterica subsp. enterica serovar Minnesota]ECI4646696.1 hypothetical protein [Salmonella enterica subsp. salamae]